jgi:PadR family transcriptional regulator PadR
MPRDRRPSAQSLKLLASLLGRPGEWRHGYALSKESGLKAGTLYPLLRRLSGLGLLESHWEASGRPGAPPRHCYRLTDTGVSLARTSIAAAHTGPASGAG